MNVGRCFSGFLGLSLNGRTIFLVILLDQTVSVGYDMTVFALVRSPMPGQDEEEGKRWKNSSTEINPELWHAPAHLQIGVICPMPLPHADS